MAGYLQLEQLDEEQLPQPEPPEEEPVDDLPMPNRDRSLFVSFEPHWSQFTSGFDPKTSFSNSAPQALHWYSKIGMTSPE